MKAAGYNFLEDVTAVDWYPSEPRFQMTYHILSHALKQRMRLVVRLDGDGRGDRLDYRGMAFGELL